MEAAFLVAAMLAIAGVVFHFAAPDHAGRDGGRQSAVRKSLASESVSLPLFFEPNQGQTAPQVKFLAHGTGYGLFLTADEAVLHLQPSAVSTQHSALAPEPASSSVIRMRLDGANSSARVSGASPLPGKSNYFIGNDPSKWRRDIPHFARVQYQAVYPGIDLVYYGNQGQLEYDFRVAPGADPNQIALNFTGASAHIDSADLILSTDQGDVRFRAPHIYQQDGDTQKSVAGGFRQIADNKIVFSIGDYDHSRELVIDPVLSYSTYLGGSGTEALVKIAVDANQTIYVAGSTNSVDFPLNPPGNSSLTGAQNIFISKINTTLSGTAQLVYSIYLGGTQSDNLAGIAVDSAFGIYVAGWTTSPDFPTTSNAFTTSASGTHGFLSKLTLSGTAYGLTYSTYLAGNGIDTVTGLAIDSSSDANAFVTGDTTSSNLASDGFPANPNGYQTVSNSPGNPQFFASKINTGGSGPLSMLYSTYFGGGNPAGATARGGGIAVDPSGNMYITGATNMLPVDGGNPGEVKFPLFNAQQSCLDEASKTICTPGFNTSPTDAFVAKINPNPSGYGAPPVYSTYLGGSGSDVGAAIAVDSSGNAYVTGSTNSGDWVCATSCVGGFQPAYAGSFGATNAFIAKIGNLTGSVYPVTYFTYLGGDGPDSGQDIKVDSVQAAHVTGSTSSPNFPTTLDAFQPGYGLLEDAFVALISTTSGGQAPGDYSSYLGGNQLDQGTGIAFDNIFGATYVAGATQSSDFIPPPLAPLSYQSQLNGPQDAFVTKIGASSTLNLTASSTSPSPSPVAAGTPVAFTFNITNKGPDTATNVTFYASVPTTGLASTPTAKVTSGSGSCGAASGATIQCNIPTLAMNAVGAVEVDVTPSITGNVTQISVSGSASANGGVIQGSLSQQVKVVDFGVAATTSTPTINAGDPAVIQVKFCPTNSQLGYSATITPSQTTSPSMVTATTPVFNPTTVTLSGSSCQTTALSIATVARPVTTGSLLRRGSFYAAWLPIGGLSLVGLGIGAGRKRRRRLAGVFLCLIAGAILLQSGCGSSSSSVSTGGGTQAGTYIVTITGSAGTGASHTAQVTLTVH
jgi:uncharacterized repeat protein (TIGR01451 family)